MVFLAGRESQLINGKCFNVGVYDRLNEGLSREKNPISSAYVLCCALLPSTS